MALVFDDPRPDRRQFGHLMPPHRADGFGLFQLLWQGMPALEALRRQHEPDLIDSIGGSERPMRSAMTGLAAYFALAFLSPAPLAGFAGEAIGGRGLGGSSGILPAKCQLPLQIGDLLFGVGDLLVFLDDLLVFLSELLGLLVELLPQLLD